MADEIMKPGSDDPMAQNDMRKFSEEKKSQEDKEAKEWTKNQEQTPQTKPKRPGGELYGKPCQGPDGQWYDKFGQKIENQPTADKENADDKDQDYAQRFWSREKPKGLREVMIETLTSAVKDGEFNIFVDPKGITETDKEKISAYRVLAGEIGLKIGQFRFNRESYTARADIEKI